MSEFTIHIYPKFNYESPTSLGFDSVEQKKLYIKAEFKFCIEEQMNYRACRFCDSEQARHDLQVKRIEFAKNNGFAPDKTRPKEWTRQTKTEDLLA